MEQWTSKGFSNPSVHNSPPTKFEDLNNGYKESHPAAIEEKKWHNQVQPSGSTL